MSSRKPAPVGESMATRGVPGLQNEVRDFNGLARKPLCYRYTIPQ
jgi:hypothetical protein